MPNDKREIEQLNSRMNDRDWQDLVGRIVNNKEKGDDQKKVYSFVCYSDIETKRVKNKIKKAIKVPQKRYNFNSYMIEFPTFSDSGASDIKEYYKILRDQVKQEEEQIPTEGTTIIVLYEPIDFDCILTNSGISEFHTRLRKLILNNNKTRLLLFGNINYELVHSGANSSLRPEVRLYYIIEDIKAEFVEVFKGVERSTHDRIIKWTDGHLDILPEVERFCKNIRISDRLTELMEHYLSVPIKALQEEIAKGKLAGLSSIISKNNLANADDIVFDGNQCQIRIKNTWDRQELLQSYFEKTSLFKPEKRNGTVIVKPKERFRQYIIDTGFFERRGIIDQSPDPGANLDKFREKMGLIQAFFSKYETSKPVFILGAGTSISSGAPVNIDFMNSILSEIFNNRGQKYIRNQNITTLTRHFWDEISRGNPGTIRNIVTPKLEELQPSTGHFYLARMVSEGKIQIILTTNFDNLIEDSLMDFGIRSRGFIKIIGERDTPDWGWINRFSGEKLKIFKLCGDLFYGPELALTDTDSDLWIKNASDTLSEILKNHKCDKFIILGHAFTGEMLRNWLRVFSSRYLDNPIRIAFINPDESACTNFENYCRSFCPEPILIHGNPGRFGNFMEKLHERLEGMKDLKEKLHESSETIISP